MGSISGQVHPAILILEDPQGTQLLGRQTDGLLVITLLDADQNQSSETDPRDLVTVYRDRSTLHPLQDHPHDSRLRR
jgi:hypothetical protein